MTPAELEAIRERTTSLTRPVGALYKAELDREALLDHADALQAQLDAARAEVERLRRAAVTASAEMRHTYRPETRDWNLVARAIRILEEATTPTAALSETGGER